MKTNINRNRMFWSILAGLLAATLTFTGCGKSAATTQVSPLPSPSYSAPVPSSSSPSISTLPASPTSPVSPVPISSSEAEQIVNNVLSKTAALSSYRLTRNIVQTFSPTSKVADQVVSKIFSKSSVDASNKKMEMANSISLKQPAGQVSWPIVENALYIVDGTMYLQGLFPDAPQSWSKTPVTPAVWQIQNQVGAITGFLKPQAINGLSQESIKVANNVSSRILVDVTADQGGLWSFMANQPGVQLPAALPQGLTYNQVIKNSLFKIWVDPSSRLPLEAEIDMDVLINPEVLPSFKGTFSSSIKVNLVFSEFNQPVVISLPADAKDALDLSLEKIK
jgi:hypothetical protein